VLSGTVGTALAVLGTAPAEAPYPTGGVLVTRNPIGGHRLLLAYTKTAAIVLTWFRDNIVAHLSYEDLLAEAAQVPPGCDGLTALPHLSGMATPSFDDAVRGGFVGLSMLHDRRHFTRAIMESVCFGARDCVKLIREAGVDGDTFIASGGATKSGLWMQILADVLGLPVRVPDCPEAACRGGALLGLLAAGRQEALSWPADTGHASTSYAPDATNRGAYAAAYDRYSGAMDALYPGSRVAPR
jgi:xylulokinase